MATTKEFKDFICEQLSEVENLVCKPMMGEFLLYCNGVLFGGIYDGRLLIKKQKQTKILIFQRFCHTSLPNAQCISLKIWKTLKN